MRILVTGGAGYIGSILVPALLREGHEVTVVDSFMFGQATLLDVCADPKLRIVRGDVRDNALMKDLLRDADVIFPLACLTGAPLCKKDPIAAQTTIVDAIRDMLKVRSADQLIVYPNTNSGYGVGEAGRFCTEETPIKPISLYGKTKCEAEAMILEAGNSIAFRLATVFGTSPRMRIDLLVNDFTYRAVFDRFIVLFEADFKRNYVHVRDVSRAFIHALGNADTMSGEAYNLGLSSANLSKWELCEEIVKQVPDFYFVRAEIGEDEDKRDYVVSNEKLEATGFRCEYDLQAGIAELVKAYQVTKRNQYANV
ncbi:MAG: NAD(P)-dependent oxidoreductase [Coriobacteriia bacterium]